MIDINENTDYGIANFTVVNAQTLAPIAGATLTITTDTDGIGTFTTDADGKVSAILPVGTQTVSAYAENTLVRNLKVEIAPGVNVIPKIGLSDKPTYEASLTSKEMTYDEIVAAGIDPDAPENNHVYSYKLEINFSAEFDLYSLFYYMNERGEVISGETVEDSEQPVKWYAWGTGSSGGGCFYLPEEDITVIPVTENFYIIVRGSVKWLKEMFDVEMLVINNSATDTLENVVAELELPEGLSLAKMVEGEQVLAQEIGTVAESSSESVHWYVCGNVAGSYQLTAKLTGKVMPFNEEIDQTYTTENALEVWAGSALQLDFEFPDAAYYGEDYPITITLTNVSDKTLYKLDHSLSITEGMEYYYDDGTSKVRIEKANILGAGVLNEFNPGDKIVIETNVNIFFKSELLEAQKQKLIDLVDGIEKLMKCFDAVNTAYEAAQGLIGAVSGAYNALSSYAPTTLLEEELGKEKFEVAKKIYQSLAKMRKYTTTGNKIIDKVWDLFDASMSLNIMGDLEKLKTDPVGFLKKNSVKALKDCYKKLKTVGDACEASVEKSKGIVNYKFDFYESIKTLISAIPIRFVVSSIIMTEGPNNTTSIPYNIKTYSTGAHYFGVDDLTQYFVSLTNITMSQLIGKYVPWYVSMFVNIDDILDGTGLSVSDPEADIRYVRAAEQQIKAFQAKDATGDITWTVKVIRNQQAQTTGRRSAKSAVMISDGFELSCSNPNAVIENGEMTFTGGGIIYVKPTSAEDGTMYIENSEGASYTYNIEVAPEHTCTAGDREIALHATEDRDGIAVTRCSVCDQIIDVDVVSHDACESHSFGDWVTLYAGDCQTCGIRQHACVNCGYTESELTEYGEHVLEKRNPVDATCSTEGYEGDIYCSVCGEFIERGNTIGKLAHTPDDAVVKIVKAATCTETGIKTETVNCSICGEEISSLDIEAPALGHIDDDNDNVCDRCGEKIGEPFGGEDQGGENDGLCKYCGKDHSGSFWQRIVGFFHRILYFFAHLFGKM